MMCFFFHCYHVVRVVTVREPQLRLLCRRPEFNLLRDAQREECCRCGRARYTWNHVGHGQVALRPGTEEVKAPPLQLPTRRLRGPAEEASR